jgi:quercetin dioxygenase-like cupin family protein
MTTVEKPLFHETDLPILKDHLQKISMIGRPLLSQGQVTEPLVICENLWISSKIYSAGGERHLHYHPDNDHCFFVLQGTMAVWDENGNRTDLKAYEGMVIPANVAYKFECTSTDQNLVILRVAGSAYNYYKLREMWGRGAVSAAKENAGHGEGEYRHEAPSGTNAVQPVESGKYFMVD